MLPKTWLSYKIFEILRLILILERSGSNLKIRIDPNISKLYKGNFTSVSIAFNFDPPGSMVIFFYQIYNIFYQVIAIYKFDPESDPHFRFLCEHGANGRASRIFMQYYSAAFLSSHGHVFIHLSFNRGMCVFDSQSHSWSSRLLKSRSDRFVFSSGEVSWLT